MNSPWLGIPLSDYESHMDLPEVGQAALLADLLAEVVRLLQPLSLAVPGCAGGNGLERLRDSSVERVVGIDINPEYVREAGERFKDHFPELQMFVGDVQTQTFNFDPVDLVFVGLLLEYVDPAMTCFRLRRMVRFGGVVVTVLQIESGFPEVSPSPFSSLAYLTAAFRYVDPVYLRECALENGLREFDSKTLRATGGKSFRIQYFRAY